MPLEFSITRWTQERSGHDTRSWHYGYDQARRLTSATLKNPAQTILATHTWQYDPGGNRIASQHNNHGIIPSAHNALNNRRDHKHCSRCPPCLAERLNAHDWRYSPFGPILLRLRACIRKNYIGEK